MMAKTILSTHHISHLDKPCCISENGKQCCGATNDLFILANGLPNCCFSPRCFLPTHYPSFLAREETVSFLQSHQLVPQASFIPLMRDHVPPSESLKFLLVRGPAKVSSDKCASVIPTNIPHVLQDQLRLKDISHLDPSFIRCPTGSCLFLAIQRLLTVTKNDRAQPIYREGDEPSFVLRAKRQGHHLVII